MSTTQPTLKFEKSMYEVTKDDEGVLHVVLDATAYEANRPEDVPADVEKRVDAYRQSFTAAVIESAADIVAKAMKKDSAIQQAVVSNKAGKAMEIEATVSRSREGWNPKTREPLTSFGSTTVRVTTAYRKVGPIKVACATMADRIKDAVGK